MPALHFLADVYLHACVNSLVTVLTCIVSRIGCGSAML